MFACSNSGLQSFRCIAVANRPVLRLKLGWASLSSRHFAAVMPATISLRARWNHQHKSPRVQPPPVCRDRVRRSMPW